MTSDLLKVSQESLILDKLIDTERKEVAEGVCNNFQEQLAKIYLHYKPVVPSQEVFQMLIVVNFKSL